MSLNGKNETKNKVLDLSCGTGTKHLGFKNPDSATPRQPLKLLRLPLVEDRTGAKKSSIYAWVKAHTFPAPVRLSARAVGWREEDIDRWISERATVGQA